MRCEVSKICHVKTRIAAALALILSVTLIGAAQQPQVYTPEVGQQGKDVVWVPTPPELVEKMLDMAKVTAADYVIDLGSGDGRNVIAAAKRGARALGVEFNPDMVALSTQRAAEAGVSDKATFVQGDMFEADFSEATVLAMFLLPDNLERLKAKMLKLKPGTRVVLNTFGVPGWTPEATERVEGSCASWCTALLYTLPVKPE
jgi:SAM-dependent methyltransferase